MKTVLAERPDAHVGLLQRGLFLLVLFNDEAFALGRHNLLRFVAYADVGGSPVSKPTEPRSNLRCA